MPTVRRTRAGCCPHRWSPQRRSEDGLSRSVSGLRQGGSEGGDDLVHRCAQVEPAAGFVRLEVLKGFTTTWALSACRALSDRSAGQDRWKGGRGCGGRGPARPRGRSSSANRGSHPSPIRACRVLLARFATGTGSTGAVTQLPPAPSRARRGPHRTPLSVAPWIISEPVRAQTSRPDHRELFGTATFLPPGHRRADRRHRHRNGPRVRCVLTPVRTGPESENSNQHSVALPPSARLSR
jgi:hypothetical protein